MANEQFNKDTDVWYDALIARLDDGENFAEAPGVKSFIKVIVARDKNKDASVQQRAIPMIMRYVTGLFGDEIGTPIRKQANKVYTNSYADEFANQYGPSSQASEFTSALRQALTYNNQSMKVEQLRKIVKEELRAFILHENYKKIVSK